MDLKPVFNYIEANRKGFIGNLAESVQIQSVSAWPEKRGEIVRMLEWVRDKFLGLGAALAQIEPLENVPSCPPLPGVLLAEFKSTDAEKKPTLLIYGHLDVQPALLGDGWKYPPFELTVDDGKLYGRGSTDDKGPVLGWLHAIEAYNKCNIPLPVNLRFILEGMEESGSEGLDDFLLNSEVARNFLAPIDVVCISDNYWLGTTKPCLTFGLRGISYFFVEVACAKQDLHSGIFGGTVHEAMADLVHILSSLVSKDGHITIDGLHDSVAKATDEELARYDAIEFDIEEYKSYIGTKRLAAITADSKKQALIQRWREPSLSIHGIEGAFAEAGSKTVIPHKVTGKFSIRLVPNQTPQEVERVVKAHVERVWSTMNSPNRMTVTETGSGLPWLSDVDHDNYVAARRATQMVYGVEPDMTREGGSIPVTLTLQEATGKNVLLLPMGAADDGAHSQNEKINEVNFIEGTKLFAAYLSELGALMKKC